MAGRGTVCQQSTDSRRRRRCRRLPTLAPVAGCHPVKDCSTSSDRLGGEWERKFAKLLKRYLSGGYAIEFAIVSELFVSTLHLVAVAPFLNEKFTMLLKRLVV